MCLAIHTTSISQFARHYSTTILLTPAYSLGFCASLFLIIQIATGFTLASHYVPTTEDAFEVIHSKLMRDLDAGWLLRQLHANGAALFFVVVYAHMFRILYHGSVSKTKVWIVGVVMYLLLCAISFTGYSLVYGQMSLWAIVVICSLVTAIPTIGQDLLILIWGGSVVSTSTLQRVFCVHYLLPLVLTALVLIHLYFLHEVNSTGEFPIIMSRSDRINFYPLLLIRDMLIGANVLILYSYFVFFDSDVLGHPDNYVPANPMVTPPEIMPEFYFLPFYAIIRAIPHKALGIVVLVFIILSLTNIMPTNVRWWASSMVSPLSRALLFIFLLDIVMASKLCLLINHSESMYLLLLISVLGLWVSQFHSSAS